MERKIKGAFCIKDFPNNRFGVHKENYEGLDFLYDTESWRNYTPERYPEYWKIAYEDEFKVGDYIYFMDKFDRQEVGYIGKILFLNEDDYNGKYWLTYTSLNIPYQGGFRVEGNGYYINKHFRLATPEEIKSVQTKTIVVGENKKIKVTISKGKIEAEGKCLRFQEFSKIWNKLCTSNIFDGTSWEVSYPQVKIGCTIVPKSDIELIINTYNFLNE